MARTKKVRAAESPAAADWPSSRKCAGMTTAPAPENTMDDATKRKCEKFLEGYRPEAFHAQGLSAARVDEIRSELRRIKGLKKWAPGDYDFVFMIVSQYLAFDGRAGRRRSAPKRLKLRHRPVLTSAAARDIAAWFKDRPTAGAGDGLLKLIDECTEYARAGGTSK